MAFLSGPRWAVAITAFMALASFVGVVLPQLPAWAADDPIAQASWLAQQEGRLGPATSWLWRLGLLNVFRAPWFAIGLGLMVASLLAYLVKRIPGLWTATFRPRRWLPDGAFDHAPERALFHGAQLYTLLRALRWRLYRVDVQEGGGAVYFFADRFPWAQWGTVLSHGAVVVLVLAAAIGKANAYSLPLLLAEGGVQPVFPTLAYPRQMEVEVIDVHARFDPTGLPLEYSAQLALYRHGQQVSTCTVRVNSPCHYAGHSIHLASYFGFGAEVAVQDEQGRTIYHETLALTSRRPAPSLQAWRGGELVYQGAPALGTPVPSAEGPTSLAMVALEGKTFLIALREGEKRIAVIDASRPQERAFLSPGAQAEVGGLLWQFLGLIDAPSAQVTDLPLPPSDVGTPPILQLENVVYGADDTAKGTKVAMAGPSGSPILHILGLGGGVVTLPQGEAVQLGPYRYQFLGQREYAGLEVRKDPSVGLVFIGAGLMVAGLMLTFWAPRRRLWGRVKDGELCILGQELTGEQLYREITPLLAKGKALVHLEVDGDDAHAPSHPNTH